jgi:hypothetical protein
VEAILVLCVIAVIKIGVPSLIVTTIWLPIPWLGGRMVRAGRRQAEQHQPACG